MSKAKAKRVTDPSAFARRHWHVDDSVHRTVDRVPPEFAEQAKRMQAASVDSDPMYLHANNAQARINFAKLMAAELGSAAADNDTSDFHFVTIGWSGFIQSLEDAAAFSIHRIVKAAQEALTGFSFVGMVEAGFNTSLGDLGFKNGKGVEWHIHAVLWGCSGDEIEARVDELNARSGTGRSGKPDAHVKALTKGRVAGQARYMCKHQLVQYRGIIRWAERVNPLTGEITEHFDGWHRRWKGDIRPGDAYQMYLVFQDRHIDDLAFAGGNGVPVLKRVKDAALLPLEIHHRRLEGIRSKQDAAARQREASARRRIWLRLQ